MQKAGGIDKLSASACWKFYKTQAMGSPELSKFHSRLLPLNQDKERNLGLQQAVTAVSGRLHCPLAAMAALMKSSVLLGRPVAAFPCRSRSARPARQVYRYNWLYYSQIDVNEIILLLLVEKPSSRIDGILQMLKLFAGPHCRCCCCKPAAVGSWCRCPGVPRRQVDSCTATCS